MFRFLLVLTIVIYSLSSFAATISVRKDGSGDFSIIQDAVDVAASGDTIFIGPGRFEEGQIVVTPGWESFIRVLISQEELTLIGSGSDVSIIGPTEPFSFSQDDHRGIEAGPYFGSHRINVSGLGFENMRNGIGGASASAMNISNCRFEANYTGIFYVSGPGLTVDNCFFNSVAADGLLIYTNSTRLAHISNCDFVLPEDTFEFRQQGVQFDSTSDLNITGCNFHEGRRGLVISGAVGSIAQIGDCSFSGQSIRGLYISGCSFEVDNCSFQGQKRGMYFGHYLMVADILNSSFLDIDLVSLEFSYVGRLNVSNCILEKGEQYVIKETDSDCTKGRTPGLPVLFMENNDWGTDVADSIASWIKVCDYEVDFIPFVGGLSPVETPEPLIQLSVHPNPFNPRTTVSFTIDQAQNVELSMFDMTGKRIAMLADQEFQAGVHSIDWQGLDFQGRAVASGTYLLRMVTDESAVSEKMMLVR